MNDYTYVLDTDYKNLSLKFINYEKELDKTRYFLNNYSDANTSNDKITSNQSKLTDINSKLSFDESMINNYIQNILPNSELLRKVGVVDLDGVTLSQMDQIIDRLKANGNTADEQYNKIIERKYGNVANLLIKLLGLILIIISFYILK